MIVLFQAALLLASDPWIMSPPGDSPSRPNVHSVEVKEHSIVVRSSGLALRYLGLLQSPPVPQTKPREFVFEIPRAPKPATLHSRIPVEIAGVFVNGMPTYNQCETLSYNGANLWHYDAVAANDDGTLTVAGHPHAELTHRPAAGLLEELAKNGDGPLIGFALDGYPIYGKRMRSSYRLRSIARRETWPDGTRLTPEQYGPDVDATNPLGTFSEDYEYVAGSGDLDEFNGRSVNGTYAYFLAADESGRLAYPYLIGPRYYGALPTAPKLDCSPLGTRSNVQLSVCQQEPRASASGQTPQITMGTEIRFRLEVPAGRHFEYVHERPIHFLVISSDLADFDHIHPELAGGDRYEVAYTFARGGSYRLWADFSLPGEAPRIESWDVLVTGPRGSDTPEPTSTLHAELIARKPLRTGEDIPINLKLEGAAEKLEPYLGAWAHVIIVNQGLASFAHAHPVDNSPAMVHTHVLGPTPSEINIVTSFPTPGFYKLWAQFQQSGKVVTLAFLLNVEEGPGPPAPMKIPSGALRISITQRGYQPARLEIPADRAVTLAFTREESPNCGAEVLFPLLGIRRTIPLGQTVLVDLPAQPKSQLTFSCGMGMYRGMLIVK
jgi:hypothetical protein